MVLKNSLNEPRVLVVNDDSSELNIFVNGLQAEGIDTQGCTTPKQAISQVANTHFDVVLVDLMIPEMNGLQLARKLRMKFPHIITMLMSDYLLSPVQLAKADAGIVGFVPKPCRFHELSDFVREKTQNRISTEEDNSTSTRSRSISNSPFDVLSVQFSM